MSLIDNISAIKIQEIKAKIESFNHSEKQDRQIMDIKIKEEKLDFKNPFQFYTEDEQSVAQSLLELSPRILGLPVPSFHASFLDQVKSTLLFQHYLTVSESNTAYWKNVLIDQACGSRGSTGAYAHPIF